MIPLPLTVRLSGQVMVNALAPALNTIPPISIGPESEMLVILEPLKLAVSEGPFGTVFGVQFAAVFQSPLIGLALQVALPANEWAAIKHEKTQMTRKSLFIPRSQQKAAMISRQYEERELVSERSGFARRFDLRLPNDCRSAWSLDGRHLHTPGRSSAVWLAAERGDTPLAAL